VRIPQFAGWSLYLWSGTACRRQYRNHEKQLTVIIDLQVNQGQCTWPELWSTAHAADRAGYNTLWIADHLSGSVMNAPSMPECFATLGALAAATRNISLGSLVVNAGLRDPAIVANAAATVQEISGGRFILGLGAGASPSSTFASELNAIGAEIPVTMEQRHKRLEHVLDVLDAMWSNNRDDKFATFPLPQDSIPRILGVNSVALATLAGKRCEGVNIRASHGRRGEILRAAQDAAGKREFMVSVWDWFDESLLDENSDIRKQLASEGVNRLILLMRGAPDTARIEDSPVL
jgi:alkanesulfonate monooxygenase SsuD/methylene tetrahydromethanopterin reductase-like flavin-dependent oxidoreductase (luciferase family)